MLIKKIKFKLWKNNTYNILKMNALFGFGYHFNKLSKKNMIKYTKLNIKKL